MKIFASTDNLNGDISLYSSVNLMFYKHYLCTAVDEKTNLESKIDYWDLNNLNKSEFLKSYVKEVNRSSIFPNEQRKFEEVNLIVLTFSCGEQLALEVNSIDISKILVIENINKNINNSKTYSKEEINVDLKFKILSLRKLKYSNNIMFQSFILISSFTFIFFRDYIPTDWQEISIYIFVIIMAISFLTVVGISNNINIENLVRSGEKSDFIINKGD